MDRIVSISPTLYRSPKIMTVPENITLQQMIYRMYESSGVPFAMRDYCVMVEVNGVPVPAERWARIIPKIDDHVLIYVPVHGSSDGGKDPLRTILTIVVVVVAAWATGGGAAGLLGSTFAKGTAGAALLGAGGMTAGMLLVNAIAPIRSSSSSLSDNDYSDSPTYSLSGASNTSNPFGPVPVNLGRNRVYPNYGTEPYTEIEGNDEYLYMSFVWAYGPNTLENLKIGDALLSSYDDYVLEHYTGWSSDPALSLIPLIVKQTPIGVTLTNSGGLVTRAAPEGVDIIKVDIACATGLLKYNSDGVRTSATVQVMIYYREVGAGSWTEISNNTNIAASSFTLSQQYKNSESYSPTLVYSYPTTYWGVFANEAGYVFVENISLVTYTTVRRTYSGWSWEEQYVATSYVTPANRANIYYLGYVAVNNTGVISVINFSPLVGLSISGIIGQFVISVSAGYIYHPGWTLTGMTTSSVRSTRSINVDRTKNYEVGLARYTADSSDDNTIDEITWQYIKGFLNENPISFSKPLTKTALRIKATGQLSGVIDSLNGILTSYAYIWNGTDWNTYTTTRNPAALYRHVLMHPANARAKTAAKIANENLGEWYNFCLKHGYTFDMYRDYTDSVNDTLADIAAAGRASRALIDGKEGVIFDSGEQEIVQHITPRNSWGFRAEKTLYTHPHAFRVPFTNADEDFEKDEIIVYDDGYTSSNATLFESIEFPGLTSSTLNWQFGRFHIAQARLRPETYYLNQDFEHLVCRRGSKVRVQHDVLLWGSGVGARVKSLIVSGSNTTGIVLDEYVAMESGKTYGCRFRLADEDNTSLVLSVETSAGETNTLTFFTSVPTVSGPQEGDLAMFGETDQETVECLVKNIERSRGNGNHPVAQLTLVEYAPAIYLADQGAIPAFDTKITKKLDTTKIAPSPPTIINAKSGTACLEVLNGACKSRIFVYLSRPAGTVSISAYNVRYRIVGASVWNTVTNDSSNLTAILTEVTDGQIYEIQAQSVSAYGVVSTWCNRLVHICIGQSEIPDNVAGLSCNIIDNNAYLSWTANTDVDLSHYKIKWSPLTSGATWASAIDVVAKVSRAATSVNVPAMVGTYLIKAIDYAGNESETAAASITNISGIAGLNVVETVEQPTWDGTGTQCEESETYGGIILSDIYESGYYTMNDIVDLGAVYTSRLTASLAVSGQDLRSDLYDIADLYAVGDMYGAPEGSYSAGLEVRTTNDDTSGTPTWGDWKPFAVGDYTARGYQFRIALTRTAPAIIPVVEAVAITIDMPDRVIAFTAQIPDTGGTVTFSPAFYAVEGVGISTIDGAEGDGYTISSQSVSGFSIAFTNGGSGVARNITGVAKGYGILET